MKMGVLGLPRKDGCIKVDKGILRRWCDERGLTYERKGLEGQFYEYSDDEDDDDDDDEGDEDSEMTTEEA